MLEYYGYFKAFHIVGFVSWFAGLFYLVRMFVYRAEVNEKPEHLREDWKKQFSIMEWRVYKMIATPAMVITWICGLSMLALNPGIFQQSWIHVKLTLLVLLVVYHFSCRRVIVMQDKDIDTRSSMFYRLFNELPTLFLVAIVLLAVMRDLLDFVKLFFGILIFGFLLYTFVKAYKRRREKSNV
ncbi:protoporphyrinogen oxidase HemJ [Leadbetterella byssophila]|jgi:putative membrane protein|uniref:protoporphyrinogen oxidase HemJ n=1 Tax=Leadbetterella byssophila TaxID=316068 RepID=UPI0039A09389